MQYYACKCGETESFGSSPPERCQGCRKCGTGLRNKKFSSPYPELVKHNWVKRFNEITGKPFFVCRRCGESGRKEEE